MLKKPLLFLFASTLCLMQSCRKDTAQPDNLQDPAAIPVASLNKVALDYVTDRAVLIEWYVDHPEMLKEARAKNAIVPDGDTGENELVEYYDNQQIYSVAGTAQNFFELADDKRHDLMRDMIKMDAKLLTEKYALLSNPYADDGEELANDITDRYFDVSYKEELDFDSVRARIQDADPYKNMLRTRNEKNRESLGVLSTISPPDSVMRLGSFFGWMANASSTVYNGTKAVVINNINTLPVVILVNYVFGPGQLKITPTNFVNKLRADLQPGRILVSLPASVISGGDFAIGNGLYDVGHVAVVSKSGKEIPQQVGDNYSITVGTNSKDNMHHEAIATSWTSHHGAAILMQAFDNVYKETSGGKYAVEQYDFANGPIYDKIASVIGKPYVSFTQMLTANGEAPKAFICSSSAWWAIKAAHGDKADITPGFSATFPKDVFKSPRMRVVKKTF